MKETMPKLVSKLLLHTDEGTRPDFARFVVEQAGIYVEKVIPLATNAFLIPVRYDADDEIDKLVSSAKSFKFHRVFKSAWFKVPPLTMKNNRKGLPQPFVQPVMDEVLLNFLSLLKGKTVRIDSPSKDKDLRIVFYKRAVELNTKEKFDCEFDFDTYDVALIVSSYYRLPMVMNHKKWGRKWYVITYTDRLLTPIIGHSIGRHLSTNSGTK